MTEQLKPEGAGDLTPEKERELIEKIASLEQDKANLTGDLQETRKKKQEEVDALKAQLNPDTKNDVEEAVKKVLDQKKAEESALEREEVEEEFKSSKTEFNPQNDPGGLKYAAFKKELSKFNLSGLSSKKAIASRFEEVYEFMNRGKVTEEGSIQPNPAIPSGGGQARPVETTVLTPAENEVLKRLGWTKEHYLKQKAKRPVYIQTLFEHYRG